MFYVLKSSDVLDILVPILYYLNDARADQCKYTCCNLHLVWVYPLPYSLIINTNFHTVELPPPR